MIKPKRNLFKLITYNLIIMDEYNEHEEKRKERAKEAVDVLTTALNDMGFDKKNFIEAMSREHRTLQQNFSRLVLQWIEHKATDEYLVDGRNEGSKTVAKKLLEGFNQVSDVNSDSFPPSAWLGHV